ncbi:hypothetical protein [uncultured Flavobacterium sp.]|uniref:hypothetical protein n=1 Tax=uncultured Flavobacterium sp. TaxID=165435 RepID=UPI0011FC9C93|nr:hypothetical protein [uncultured Flavobacterium sp.]THD32820.1 MAG: hypothetical protein DI588_06245 [Flavobacterium johnsoniae]
MSSNSPTNPDNQEIDLAQVSRKLSHAYENFLSWIFRGFLFIKRNIIILVILFIVGAGLGFYFDRNLKIYDNEVIVMPNFGSTEYVYSKINLINSKLSENDVVFLNKIGIKNAESLIDVSIEPINDIYSFINAKGQNFELIKLMAEDGDVNKIIEDETTSINYTTHRLKIVTSRSAEKEEFISPILNYLNNSEYFVEIQKTAIDNIQIKMESDRETLSQINDLIAKFYKTSEVNKNALVNITENSQLNDILKTKQDLVTNLADNKINLINAARIVKDVSIVQNIKNNKSLNGKMKLVIPFIFVFIFIVCKILFSFYNSEMKKIKA